MLPALGVRAAFAGLLAVTIGREEAREAARSELSKPIYHRDDPPFVQWVLSRAIEWIQRLLAEASGVAPGGYAGLFAAFVIVVLVAVAIRLRAGPVRRSRRRGEPLVGGRPVSADEHRARAERHAASAEWAEAVRERLRAVTRALEERAVLEFRPGRTADELATEAGAVLPAHADELRAGTRLFDEVWYGGRAATAEAYDRVRQLDERLRVARPALSGAVR